MKKLGLLEGAAGEVAEAEVVEVVGFVVVRAQCVYLSSEIVMIPTSE